MNIRKRTFAFRTAALGALGIVALSPLTTAQTAPPILQPLPPPPAVPLPNPPPTPSWPTKPLTEPSQNRLITEPASITPQTKPMGERTSNTPANSPKPREIEFSAPRTRPVGERTSNTPANSSKPREIEFRTPQANIPLLRTSQSQLYRVEVYGTSQLNLTRVRRIAPQAFVRKREGIIQVGAFEEQERAEELVQKLAMESLWARIILVSSYASRGKVKSGELRVDLLQK